YHHHLAPPELRVRALPERYVKMEMLEPGSYEPRKALARVSPLIKGYLRLGGFVGDGAVIDSEFDSTDVFVVVKTELVTEKYMRHYERGNGKDCPTASTMWIGSPLRGTFRLLSFLTLTLILVPPYFLATALRIKPVVRWAPVIYHRIVCI